MKKKQTEKIHLVQFSLLHDSKNKHREKFISQINKHFGKQNMVNKVINKNNVKISYSFKRSIKTTIKRHSTKLLETNQNNNNNKQWNCEKEVKAL